MLFLRSPSFFRGTMDTTGRFYTPLAWGKFAVERSGILARWLAGGTVFDPTAGEGHLLVALVESALEAGHPLAGLPLDRLHGFERDQVAHRRSLEVFRLRYGADLSSTLRQGDLFLAEPQRFDAVLGNPPWKNFADLPAEDKIRYKELFQRYGLVPDRRKVLLGSSRIDIAALVVQKVLLEFLKPGGEAWFFLPLSLFLNDGAHGVFREYMTSGVPFAPLAFYDFQRERIFGSVATRYALTGFRRGELARFPVPYFRKTSGSWTPGEAAPLFAPNAPLSIGAVGAVPGLSGLRPISVERRSLPRQGVNTGGANAVFFFDRCDPVSEVTVEVGPGVFLPRAYVHPLVTAAQFRGDEAPSRWVLIPHSPTGRPLEPAAIESEPLLAAYLGRFRARLETRRGVLVGARRANGCWWSLQGIGPYSFAPYKIVWEAYGKSRFSPKLFEGAWQANQSLQAYIPCWNPDVASRILHDLGDPGVEAYLASLGMEKTMNWAQPGRIRRLLAVEAG